MVGRRQLNGVLSPLWLSSCYGRPVLEFSGLNFLSSRMGAMPSHMVILQLKYVVIGIPHPTPSLLALTQELRLDLNLRPSYFSP